MTQTAATPAPHTRIEDAQAFALGTAMCALGVTMLTHLGLITGQTAGLAVLVSYGTGLSFGLVFLRQPAVLLAGMAADGATVHVQKLSLCGAGVGDGRKLSTVDRL